MYTHTHFHSGSPGCECIRPSWPTLDRLSTMAPPLPLDPNELIELADSGCEDGRTTPAIIQRYSVSKVKKDLLEEHKL